jgi:hypothetical protein
MAAIARRSCIGIFACVCVLFADVRSDVVDLFASIASALTAVNPAQFMAAFDKDMPDYDKLKDQITALANQAEITSSIEPIKDEGDEAQRSVDLDWYLEVRSLYPNGPIIHRRDVIHCDIRKQGKHWKIVSLKPLEFFAPAKLDK